ncbi:hypothetical protein ABK905_02395 [Acerihabitans sp. KWT182]|uniref:Uncharacterized protein n=1 Tax=Acerihabitans sp. KWT182 TaxID=3157919 RepID=A0AAU7QAA9_9GAMM
MNGEDTGADDFGGVGAGVNRERKGSGDFQPIQRKRRRAYRRGKKLRRYPERPARMALTSPANRRIFPYAARENNDYPMPP